MRSRSRSRWVLVALVLVAAPAIAAGDALAQVSKHDSKLTISIAVPLYHGKVKSEAPKCVRGRRVTLFERRPGPDRKVGRGRTNRRGRWVVKVPLDELEPQDRFYAKVGRKLNIVSGEGYVCRGDRSRTRTFVGD
ncbi:MAG TPA: hypothetical protein VE401_03175 [Solirubrobacterales bacterium]|nr:hypothetical protein [Solirubrobacterales bacterium]